MSRPSARELAIAAAIGLAALAALVPMSEIFVEGAWIRPAVVSVLVALALAVAARALGLGATGAVAVTLVGYLVVQSAIHLPDAPLVPWLDELRALRDLVRDGLVQVRDEASPTQALPGLVLLVSTGAWAVTFVGHELAVRLRATGLALVPIATLWVVPLAVPQTVPPGRLIAVPFLAAAALVLLTDADADLVGWARDRVRPRIGAAGVGIAASSIALGLVAPWLLPGLGEPALLPVGTGRNPSGYQPIIDIGDRLTLPIDRAVLRVRSDRRNYLRLAALDTYDDDKWIIGPEGEDSFTPEDADLYSTRDPLPPETAIAEATRTVVEVEVLDLENIYVPTPYQPVEVTGPGAADMVWSTVGGFLATGELSDNEIGGNLRTGVVQGFEYRVEADVPTPSYEQLRTVEASGPAVEPWLQLPGDPEDWTEYAEEAERIWALAGATTTYDRAYALQQWFRVDGGFDYSLTDIDPLRGSDALEQFVFTTKTGYCEYFATAMAVMLRAAGIPARTAVGFLPGEVVAEGGADGLTTYQVSTSDAHAWVEVLFPGYGWYLFEPTPRSDGATIPPSPEDVAPQTPIAERPEGEQPAETPSSSPTGPDPTAPDATDVPDLGAPLDADDEGGSGGATTDDERRGPWLPVTVVGALVVGTGLLLRRRSRAGGLAGFGGRDDALAAQRRVLREAERLGVPRRHAETAIEALHRWATEGRVDPARAAELAALGQRAAFARAGTRVDGRRARVLADELTDELRSSVGRPARWLAPVRVPATRGATVARRLVETGRDRLTPGTD